LDTSRVQAWERAVGDRNTEPRGRKDRRASGEDEPDSPLQDMLRTVIRATVEGLQEAGAGLVGRPPEPVGEPPPGGIPVPPVKARGWLKLDHYDGSTPWETYRIQLDECCTYNGWNDAEKLAQLTIALRDPARRVLLHRGSGSSFASLCHELQTHFGTEGSEAQAESALRIRRRKKDEELRTLHQDILQLTLRAYPDFTGPNFERIAKEAFITALNNEELALQVRNLQPKDLLTAYHKAQMLEEN